MNTLDRSSSSARILNPLRLLLVACVFVLAGSARADNVTWIGGGNPDGQWTNTLNWLNGIVPPNPLTFSNYNAADGSVIYDSDPGFYDSIVSHPWTIGRLQFTTNSGSFVLSGADLTLNYAQSAGTVGQGSIDIAGASTVTISNNLIFPAAATNPATNIRHQFFGQNTSTINFYGNLIKPNDGPGQLSFRGSGGTFNVYGAVLWDTNILSRTDVSTLGLYNPGNAWTRLNISVGTVLLGVDNALPTTSWLDFNQNSAGASFLRMTNFNQTLAAFSSSVIGTGSFTQVVDTATSSILTVRDNGVTNTFGGMILGGGQFLKTGNGTLILATNNSTYTGGTLIGGGILSLGSGTTGGAITGYITNNATLIVNKTDNLTLPNAITGSGQVRKLGSGTLTLPDVNPYSGGTVVSNGTMLVSGSLSGNGAVTVGGGTLRVDGQLSGSGAVSVFSGGTLMGSGGIAAPVTVFTNGQIQTSPAPFPATLTFSNNLTLNAGAYASYKFGGPTTVGGGANDLFDVKGNLALNNNPLVLVPVGLLTVGNTYVVANAGGALSGSFGAITNPTRYTFTTTTSGNQAKLTVNGGTNASLLWRGTNANWDLTTFNWTNGSIRDKFYQADNVTFDDGATLFAETLTTALYPRTVNVNATNNYIFAGSGKLSGPASITKSGAGTLILSNANDFTGTVTVNAGLLQVGNGSALGATNGGTVIADGATLELNGQSLYNPGELITIAGAGLNNTGAVINSTADQQNAIRYLSLSTNATVGTWTNRWDVRGPGGNGSFSGGLYLNGYTLTKLGTNKMSLVDLIATNGGSIRAASGVLGLTRSMVDGLGFIDGGSALVQIENSSAGYVNKPMLFNGGRLQLVGNTFTLGSAITNSGMTIDVASGLTLTLTNLLTGTGSLTKVSAGTLELQQPDLCIGPTTISAGTMLLDAGSLLPNSSAISVASGATLDVSAVTGGLVLTNGATLSGSGTVQGDITAGSGTTVSPGSSPGILTVTGNTTLSNATLNFELGANPAAYDPGNDFLATSGNLNLSGVTTVNLVPIANLSPSSPYPIMQFGNLASGGAANLKVATQSRYLFSLLDPATTAPFVEVQIVGGQGSVDLIWQGGAAANPTAWDLKTTRNWLNRGAPDFFYTGDNAIFDDTAQTNFAALVGNLSPLAVTLSNNIIDFTFGGSGAIVSGSLTSWGSRSLRVANTAANTFSGLDVENGSVTLSNAAANSLPNGFTVNNGTLTFANTGVNTFSTSFTVNAGAVIFNNGAANDFGPGFNLNAGTLTIANAFANNLGTSPVIGSTLRFLQPADVAVGNALTGTGIILKQSTNMLTLSANNGGFTGTLQVENGVLRNGATGGLSAGNVVVKDGASLDVGGQNCTSATSTTIQGNGFNGTGAIRNTGADQQNGFRNVGLAANALVSGPNRWDIRGATSGGFGAVLDLAGFKLQKQSANKIAIVDATLPNDGTIELLGGILTLTRSMVGGTQPIIIGTNMLQFENDSLTNALVSKPLTIAGGYIQVVGNSYGIYSPITNLGGANVDIANGLTFFLSNTISGSGLLIKTNTGTLVINAANTFTGNVLVQGGVLQAGNNLALPANNTVVLSNTTALTGGPGGTLDLLTNVVTPANVTLTAYTTFLPDIRTSLRGAGPGTEWKGPINLNGDGRFGLYADSVGSALNISGSINGPATGTNTVVFIRGASGVGQLNGRANFIGQMFKTDGGTWLVNSTSNIWSTTGVAVGTLRLGANNALCPTAPLTMGQADTTSPVLDLNGFSQTVNGLAFVASTSTGTRRIGNDSTNTDSVFTLAGTNVNTYPGQFVDNVTINGNHKLSLVVASGTLYLNGVNSNTGPTVVQNGATLGGIGALLSSVTVQAGGTLSPGSGAVGRLAISNNLTFAAGAIHLAEVNAATGTNDMVFGLTNVTYAGTLVISNVSSSPLTNGATFKLFDAAARSGAFASVVSQTPGQAVTWDTSRLTVDGTITVAQAINTQAPTMTTAVSAGVLAIAWPTNYLGWRLLSETNNTFGVGLITNSTNWFYVPGSSSTNAVYMNIDQTKGSVFYRLVYP